MGLDFIRRASPGFQKAWDRGRTALATPTLFSCSPQLGRRSVIADFASDFIPRAGGEYAVYVDGPHLVLVDEVRQVGRLRSPPAELVEAVRAAGGAALGVLTRFNPISGTGDVEVE